LPWPSTPLVAGLLIAFRGQEAMSPASHCRDLIWRASGSNCCAACPRSPPIGNTGQRRLSSGQRRVGAGPNCGARTRVGICCFGNTASRGHSACLRRGKRPCGCFVCCRRSFSDRKCGSNHQIGPGCRVASHIQQPRVRGLRRPHSLWAKCPRTVSACGG
jgi:hypothetical protein